MVHIPTVRGTFGYDVVLLPHAVDRCSDWPLTAIVFPPTVCPAVMRPVVKLLWTHYSLQQAASHADVPASLAATEL